MTSVQPSYSKWQIWLLAARPKTLWAAIGPVVIGGALALDAGFGHVPSWIAAMLGAIFIQIGTNFANDLFDFKKATDTAERLGPLRVTHAGLVTPTQMRNATIVVFSIAFFIGMYLVYRGGWPIVGVGLLSILFGVLYTGGPFPLGYNGLGEIFVFIFFGPVAVAGTYFVMAQQFSMHSLILGIPPGLLSSAILVVNNVRDIETDGATNKRTLAVRIGKQPSKYEFVLLVVVALIFPVIWYIATHQHPFSMLATAALIPAIPAMRTLLTADGRILNSVLAGTGIVLAVYSVLFAVGWLL